MRLLAGFLKRGRSLHLLALAVLFLTAGAIGIVADAVADSTPPEGAVQVGQFTTGGCVYVCESLDMCMDAHIDEKIGACWLVLDRRHADFTKLVETCPRPENRTFSAEISDGAWRLACVNK